MHPLRDELRRLTPTRVLQAILFVSGIGIYVYAFLEILTALTPGGPPAEARETVVFHLAIALALLAAALLLILSHERQSWADLRSGMGRNMNRGSIPPSPKVPEVAALLGGLCVGAGLFYAGRKKAGALCVAGAIVLALMWFVLQVSLSLWALAILWYSQIWYGYEAADRYNDELAIKLALEISDAKRRARA